MSRPDFADIKTGTEFNRWYWLKEEMVNICKECGLPTGGRKFDLRDRIMHALDNDGEILSSQAQKPATSTFNWAKAELTPETTITDNISFGPNFRRFMKSQIGSKFSCHSDFMEWAKSNSGKTLQDAVDQWYLLEDRKKNPEFRRDIADNNMYSQYVRDFTDDNPSFSINEIKQYWLQKRKLPMEDGFVRYHPTDLDLLPG